MSVYLSSPSCPSFIHLLHSLLSADLLPSDGSPAERQSTRLTCAMAVVRFINGMVDPLQTGESFFRLSRSRLTSARTLRSADIAYRCISPHPSIPYRSSAPRNPRRPSTPPSTQTGGPFGHRIHQSLLLPSVFGQHIGCFSQGLESRDASWAMEEIDKVTLQGGIE